MRGRSKYNAQATVVDNVRFDSQREAARYQELRLLLRVGEISGLELQPVYPLIVAGVQIGVWKADFRYYKRDGELVVEDSKVQATKTPVYRLKKKFVEALYGITITET